MGKQTKNFRQTKRDRNASIAASNYSEINRDPWHKRLINFVKVRGKGGENY
ncbi:MAG: hypothetical protein Q7R49_03560 [Candidatus Daviesbacteria bacterium]|nr:hypothetical protein [Candidatus Daviesbacteria bacterium]